MVGPGSGSNEDQAAIRATPRSSAHSEPCLICKGNRRKALRCVAPLPRFGGLEQTVEQEKLLSRKWCSAIIPDKGGV